MSEPIRSGKVCPSCGNRESADASRCTNCGANLETTLAAPETDFVDDDPALLYVDAENRVELDRFESRSEAELACGLLRFNQIPCELSSEVLPGLASETILWVDNQNAELAWALLADTEREASGQGNDAA
jgi:hypothetical protein